MGVERLARKSFGFLVAALLGLAIYFQAAGAVELVAANVLVAPAAGAGPNGNVRRPARRPARGRPATTSGDAILARNPFDSVTGPLDRAALDALLAAAKAKATAALDP